MRSREQLALSENLVGRARKLMGNIDLQGVDNPSARAKILGLVVQAELLEQHIHDALTLLDER